jgi:hypothetical protein
MPGNGVGYGVFVGGMSDVGEGDGIIGVEVGPGMTTMTVVGDPVVNGAGLVTQRTIAVAAKSTIATPIPPTITGRVKSVRRFLIMVPLSCP